LSFLPTRRANLRAIPAIRAIRGHITDFPLTRHELRRSLAVYHAVNGNMLSLAVPAGIPAKSEARIRLRRTAPRRSRNPVRRRLI